MTPQARTALRARAYTYYEMLAYAHFYAVHRYENSPEKLLAAYLDWRQETRDESAMARKLYLVEGITCQYFGVAIQDVRGRRRFKILVRARHVISHLAVPLASQNEIARILGYKRANIQSAKDKCAVLMENEKDLRRDIAAIQQRLEKPFAEIDAEESAAIEKQNEDENTSKDTAEVLGVA